MPSLQRNCQDDGNPPEEEIDESTATQTMGPRLKRGITYNIELISLNPTEA